MLVSWVIHGNLPSNVGQYLTSIQAGWTQEECPLCELHATPKPEIIYNDLNMEGSQYWPNNGMRKPKYPIAIYPDNTQTYPEQTTYENQYNYPEQTTYLENNNYQNPYKQPETYQDQNIYSQPGNDHQITYSKPENNYNLDANNYMEMEDNTMYPDQRPYLNNKYPEPDYGLYNEPDPYNEYQNYYPDKNTYQNSKYSKVFNKKYQQKYNKYPENTLTRPNSKVQPNKKYTKDKYGKTKYDKKKTMNNVEKLPNPEYQSKWQDSSEGLGNDYFLVSMNSSISSNPLNTSILVRKEDDLNEIDYDEGLDLITASDSELNTRNPLIYSNLVTTKKPNQIYGSAEIYNVPLKNNYATFKVSSYNQFQNERKTTRRTTTTTTTTPPPKAKQLPLKYRFGLRRGLPSGNVVGNMPLWHVSEDNMMFYKQPKWHYGKNQGPTTSAILTNEIETNRRRDKYWGWDQNGQTKGTKDKQDYFTSHEGVSNKMNNNYMQRDRQGTGVEVFRSFYNYHPQSRG